MRALLGRETGQENQGNPTDPEASPWQGRVTANRAAKRAWRKSQELLEAQFWGILEEIPQCERAEV